MTTLRQDSEPTRETQVQRRDFLKSAAFLGGCGLLSGTIGPVFARLAHAASRTPLLDRGEHPYYYNDPDHIIYSACLQCHTACPIKCKVVDGVLVKIDGNAFCPQSKIPNVPYASALEKAAPVEGKICPKGQSGSETLYDPYRIRKVLKRKPGTPRGAGQWITIDFNKAIEEIVEGGDLFGEGRVLGMKDAYALRDRSIAKAMAADVKNLQKKKMTLDEFKTKHADNLGVLLDPDHPDLGPKNNQFVFLAGRIEHGRKELMKWFTHDCLGSVNAFEHTTICEQSHHIAFEQVTNQWKGGKWTKGKHHMKPDVAAAHFVIFFGTGFSDANFGPPLLSQLTSNAVVDGSLRIAVVDPRLSRSAGKAHWWIPIRPGADAWFAMGMIRWILDNNRFDRRFLENANAAAAKADDETAWTAASYLVKIEEGRPARYLRADEVGLGSNHQFVVLREGKLIPMDPNDKHNAVEGDLEGSLDKEGISARTAFELFRDRARELSPGSYAEKSGVKENTIAEMATEFTSYGKQAVAEFYRGPVQHTNGYYAAQAIISLNILIGNSGWKGGMAQGGGHWHESGGKPGNPHNFKKMHPAKMPAFGVKINREKARYEESTLFGGYPAKRPWYPYTGNLYQEVIPSAGDAYPYPTKILFLHMGTPVLSCPAGHKQIAILRNPKKVPLLIACDLVIGETSMYADYVFPDSSIWERWGTPHITPAMLVPVSKVRQPTVAPLVETANVDGEEMPINMEAFLIAVGKKLGLPGIGKDAFGTGRHFNRQEDWFLKAVSNIAMGDKTGDAVPAASAKEIETFLRARKHLPKSVFDKERWKRSAGEKYWSHVVYVLNRGGRFGNSDRMYKGDKQAHPYKGMFQLFVENVAGGRNSISGQHFDGLPRAEGPLFANGKPVGATDEFKFHLITFKEIFGGHSRTVPANLWLGDLMPENAILMSRADAEAMGLRNGDRVRLSSPTNPDGAYDLGTGEVRYVEGEIKTLEGLRPGVVAVSWHFGHWAYGTRDLVVDGKVVKGDSKRGRGLVPNPIMLEDTVIGNVCLTDPIGGSASFSDTRVKITSV